MKENFKENSVSDKRKKYIENFKTRSTEKPKGFWNSRPLGFSMRSWRIFFLIVLIIVIWQVVNLVLLNK